MDEFTGQDFIVSELLSELKEENRRKDLQLQKLHKFIIVVVIASVIAILLVIGAFLLYLNQYDFSSTESNYTENTAEGFYAIIDSNGNIIGRDLTPEQIEEILNNGESYLENKDN